MTPKQPSKTAQRAIDWTAIAAAYRDGVAVSAIARRHRIGPSTVYRRARKAGWTRGRTPPTAARTPVPGQSSINGKPSINGKSSVHGKTSGKAAPRTATRQKTPRRRRPDGELAQLRALAARLRERLETAIEGGHADVAVLGRNESAAGLLLKLCQISEKIIAIERRLAGADAPTANQLDEHDREILDRFKRRYGVG